MALRNPFSANAAKDLPQLRRSINEAFNSIIQQANSEISNNTRVIQDSDLPRRPRFGDYVYVTVDTVTGFPSAGWYKYNGTTWNGI